MKTIARLRLALASLLLLPASAAAAPPGPLAEKALEQLVVYAAKGPPDSCGPGCDRWIAIEGRVDAGSAARVESFFRERKDTQRPIYFNSPGGEMRDGFAIGRLLRARKAVGRVGRTIVDACPGTQTDDACSLIKKNRDEVFATLTSREAVCGSACTFLLFGASTREVAPDAVVAVHGALVGMRFPLNVTEARRQEAIAKTRAEAVRMAFAFVEEMGISPDVMTLADSISPDQARVLSRQEIYNFRIDTRNLVETPWTAAKTSGPVVRKLFEVKTDGGFQRFEWRLVCGGRAEIRLMVSAPVSSGSRGASAMTIVAGAAKPSRLTKLPISGGSYEIWTAAISADTMKDMVAASRLAVSREVSLPDGKTASVSFDIDTLGLKLASADLLSACQSGQASAPRTKWPLSSPSLPSSSRWPSAVAPGSLQWPAPPASVSKGMAVVGAEPPPRTASPNSEGR